MAGKEWRFYVYVIGDIDAPHYVGKGSGYRLRVQRKAHGMDGVEIARFKREKDAYQFEREAIAELKPKINVAPGGNGARAVQKRYRKDKVDKEIERIGSKTYAARVLMNYDLSGFIDATKVADIRWVAYG